MTIDIFFISLYFLEKEIGYRLNWTRNLSENSKTREKLSVIQSELRYPIQLLN